MAIPKFLQDLAIISKLGDNPGTDNGLSPDGLRAKFDEAGIAIQNYINNTLLPSISGLANPEEGLNMKNNISMGGHRVTGLGDPQADGDAVTRKFLNARATADGTYPNCYYRMVDGVQEWLNPPMVPGEIYRTTERFRNKPVYTTVVDVGTWTAGGQVTADVGATPYPIEFRAYAGAYALPFINKQSLADSSTTYIKVDRTGTNLRITMQAGTHTQYCYVQIWFTF